MQSEELEKVVKVVAIMVISFVASDLVVNALHQVVMFVAWLILSMLLFKLIAGSAPKEVEESSTNDLIIGVISAVISAGIVLWLPNLILAVSKIGLMLLMTYGLLRYFAPDVLLEIKKEVMGSG